MKRSDMVLKVAKIILETTDYKAPKAVAEAIITEMEKQGMKPPNIQRCFCHDCNCRPKLEWEKE